MATTGLARRDDEGDRTGHRQSRRIRLGDGRHRALQSCRAAGLYTAMAADAGVIGCIRGRNANGMPPGRRGSDPRDQSARHRRPHRRGRRSSSTSRPPPPRTARSRWPGRRDGTAGRLGGRRGGRPHHRSRPGPMTASRADRGLQGRRADPRDRPAGRSPERRRVRPRRGRRPSRPGTPTNTGQLLIALRGRRLPPLEKVLRDVADAPAEIRASDSVDGGPLRLPGDRAAELEAEHRAPGPRGAGAGARRRWTPSARPGCPVDVEDGSGHMKLVSFTHGGRPGIGDRGPTTTQWSTSRRTRLPTTMRAFVAAGGPALPPRRGAHGRRGGLPVGEVRLARRSARPTTSCARQELPRPCARVRGQRLRRLPQQAVRRTRSSSRRRGPRSWGPATTSRSRPTHGDVGLRG